MKGTWKPFIKPCYCRHYYKKSSERSYKIIQLVTWRKNQAWTVLMGGMRNRRGPLVINDMADERRISFGGPFFRDLYQRTSVLILEFGLDLRSLSPKILYHKHQQVITFFGNLSGIVNLGSKFQKALDAFLKNLKKLSRLELAAGHMGSGGRSPLVRE